MNKNINYICITAIVVMVLSIPSISKEIRFGENITLDGNIITNGIYKMNTSSSDYLNVTSISGVPNEFGDFYIYSYGGLSTMRYSEDVSRFWISDTPFSPSIPENNSNLLLAHPISSNVYEAGIESRTNGIDSVSYRVKSTYGDSYGKAYLDGINETPVIGASVCRQSDGEIRICPGVSITITVANVTKGVNDRLTFSNGLLTEYSADV